MTLENIGNADLSFPVPSIGSNPSIGADFTLNTSASNPCPVLGSGSSNAGTLPAGATCTLSISFVPTATGILNEPLVVTDNNLNTASPGYATQSIPLNGTGTQATPTITWSSPASITYGTPLSTALLNATSTVAGTFMYSPAVGTILGAGTQTLAVTFTPTDTADYTAATATVVLTVNQATPTIAWGVPAAITYGTALGASQLNATSPVAGTFTYSPAVGTALGVGTQTLNVALTPTDTVDYTTATATVSLTVNQTSPPITWSAPAAITYGTALSASQLNATSTVPGTFTYSPAAGTVLGSGTQTLNVTFTPTDVTDYVTATTNVPVVVNKGAPTLTWSAPSAIVYGTGLGSAQLDATSTIPGTWTYSPAAGMVLGAGTQTLSVTFTPTDTADYTAATATVVLTVNQATPAITWPTPGAIVAGTPLGSAQLDAVASVPGTFTYAPSAGTILPTGNQTLTTVFTPADSADYNTATASVSLTVNPAPGFTLTASPANLLVRRGVGARSTITLNPVNGFRGLVKLTTSGLPRGVTASYSPNPTTSTSTLILEATNEAAIGPVTLTVTGTSGSTTATTTLYVMVR